MTNIILPPSPNWFHPNAVSCNEEEKLYATASFKNIVIYSILESKLCYIHPERAISYSQGKVNGVCIYPYKTDCYKRTLAVFGDMGGISIVDCDSGTYTTHLNTKTVFNSACWVVVDGDDYVAAVGKNGVAQIWGPKDNILRTITFSRAMNFTLIEPIPHMKEEALVVTENTIVQINFKSLTISRYFKGHQKNIYCISWSDSAQNPLEVDLDCSRNTNISDDSVSSNKTTDSTINSASSRKTSNSSEESASSRKTPDSLERSVSPPKAPDSDQLNGDNRIISDISNKVARYFASSDTGKNILIWDFHLAKFVKTLESKTKQKYKEKTRILSHVALLWIDGRMYSSSVTGEVLVWTLRANCVPRVLCNMHTRVIYNLRKYGHTIISYSQDRQINGFDVDAKMPSFEIPTIGLCPRTMAFNPHDSQRLAIGFQDGAVKLISFLNENRIGSQHITQSGAKSIVLAVAWHPVEESQLLFGTSDGQVTIIDVHTKKFNTFSVHHSSDVYIVQWGPPIKPKGNGNVEEYCAYSLGGRSIYMRYPSKLIDDPIDLMITLPRFGTILKPTDFAFSPDYNLFAIGYNEGHIAIYDTETAFLKIKIECVRKIIQHLNWKPFSDAEKSYILGVGSGEITAFVFDLNQYMSSEETVTVLKATREMSGHRARIAWISWSSHNDDLLATASYDHTVQVWNYKTGEIICCYGGHPNRLFRVEFSPKDPGVLFSFSEENCLHRWNVKDVKTVCIKDAIAAANKGRVKSNSPSQKEANDVVATIEETSESSSASIRKVKPGIHSKPTSYFPTFHTACKRKRNFLHICILVLREELQIKKDFGTVEVPDDSFDEIFPEISRKKILDNILAKYGNVLCNETTVTESDVSTYLDLFGDFNEANDAIGRELIHHQAKGNTNYCDEMNIWNGNVEDHIKLCIKNNKLNSFLVSMAPMVSRRFWEVVCAAYVDQLSSESEFILAASYLICLNKEEEAVRLLAKAHLYREAVAIARKRVSLNTELIQEISEGWARTCIRDGDFELAAVLYLSIGKYDDAARTMSRRTEVWSLLLGREIYQLAGNEDMCDAMAALCLKEAARTNKLQLFQTFIDACPGLEWLKPLSVIMKYLVDAVANIVIPNFHHFNDSYRDPLIHEIKNLWMENKFDFGCINVNKYIRYFPLEIVHVSTNDVKQVMNFWLSISVALAIIIDCDHDSDFSLWHSKVNYILEAIPGTGSSHLIYVALRLFFPDEAKGTLTMNNMIDALSCNVEKKFDAIRHHEEYLPRYDQLKHLQALHILAELNCLNECIGSIEKFYQIDVNNLKMLFNHFEFVKGKVIECSRGSSSNIPMPCREQSDTGIDLASKWIKKQFNYEWNKIGSTTEEFYESFANFYAKVHRRGDCM